MFRGIVRKLVLAIFFLLFVFAIALGAEAKSISWAPHTEIGALLATEEFLGKNRNWEFPYSNQSAEFMLDRQLLQGQLSAIADFLSSKASNGTPDPVNGFLARKGLSIKLRNTGSPDDVYAAAILDVMVKWQTAGETQRLRLKSGKIVPSALLKRVTPYLVGTNNYIAGLPTTDKKVTVFMAPAFDLKVRGQSDLKKMVMNLSARKRLEFSQFDVVFPMVDYNATGSIDWMIGAMTNGTDGKPAVISQAVYQHKLRMNHLGAHGQAGAAVGATRGGPAVSKIMILDGPFLVWFEIENIVVLAYYIDEDSMKEPVGLKFD